MTETIPKRRWFRFSIRDLLWVTLVIGIGLGWWIDRKRLQREAYEAYEIEKLAVKFLDRAREMNPDMNLPSLFISHAPVDPDSDDDK
jgi:hypothetical protein